ncbi:copper homeostasis protein CutC [Sporosarcina sp. 6E9]|uniref:copper homeostasis protein CutC n=1 Tax=Sporosarcina sp. 6E9 TaxID=2819235 RepID=UPI001B3185D9|nr:copper homeostasis protein CutC [Sporosarcina sp. 6E9]
MVLEIIATSLEDAVIAEQAGADRIELCVALSEDGLTPSLGLTESVVNGVKIPVNVIVRPHNRGFHYTEDDLSVMVTDIRHIKRVGAAGIVIGALTENNKVDTDAISLLLQEAEGLDVTFHRAFDFVDNQFEALETISSFPQINQILTSGGPAPAPESAEQLKKLVKQCENKSIKIIAGSGVTPESLAFLIEETGVEQVHLGSGVRVNRSFMYPVDAEVVTDVKKQLEQMRS